MLLIMPTFFKLRMLFNNIKIKLVILLSITQQMTYNPFLSQINVIFEI